MTWHGSLFQGVDDDMGAVGEPYSAHSAQLVGWGTTPTRRGFGTLGLSGKTNRDWRQPSRASLLRRTFVVHLANLSERPPHLLFIYLFMSSTANPFTLHTTFSTPNHITGNHGGHGRSISPLLFFFLLRVVSPPLYFWLTLVVAKERRRCIRETRHYYCHGKWSADSSRFTTRRGTSTHIARRESTLSRHHLPLLTLAGEMAHLYTSTLERLHRTL